MLTSDLFGAVRALILVVSLTALVWVCESGPRETPVLNVPTVAITECVENDLEWDEPGLDLRADLSQEVGKQTSSSMPAPPRCRPETCRRLHSDVERLH